MRRALKTDRAPAAIGPYSQAVAIGNLLFTAGQIPLDPETMEIVGDDIVSQTRQVMSNMAALLEEAGAHFGSVVKSTVWLTDMAHFAEFNEIYAEVFPGDSPPARSTIAVVGLPKGVLVEIEMIVALT